MKKPTKVAGIILALLAAVTCAVNPPFSKLLMEHISPTVMAALLYWGAGIGIGIMYLFHWKKEKKSERLTKKELPYTILMILLDSAAPIFLMMGVKYGTAANASLLGNFEIVVTTIIALLIFKEGISWKLWVAVIIITLSSIVLSFEDLSSFKFSVGSLFVILATSCWGLENNCTRKISDKSTYQIVLLKGIFSGTISFIVAKILGESLPELSYILPAMLLGFVACGLSIFLYVRAQRTLGAAKTSAFYAAAPFVAALLAYLIHHEQLTGLYFLGLGLMILGTIFLVYDIMSSKE